MSSSKFARFVGAVLTVGGLSIVVPVSAEADAAEMEEILAKAVAAIGGHEALTGLTTFSMETNRDLYIMGQGVEPGRGLMLVEARPGMGVAHDLAGNRLRTDFLPKIIGGLGTNLPMTELVAGPVGVRIGEPSATEMSQRPDMTNVNELTSERVAAKVKTERLLNPHLLLRELLSDPSLATVGGASDRGGRWLREEEVYPVTLDRDRQPGRRDLVVTDAWLERWREKALFSEIVRKIEIDNEWLTRWQASAEVDDAAHQRLVIEDDSYPITLHVEAGTGRIAKVSTMEWNVILGDVPLEVTFHDWQAVGGVYFPLHLKMSIAGAPRMEVRRSAVAINTPFDETGFGTDEGWNDASHDEALAARGRATSQDIMMYGFAGAGRPVLKTTMLEPGVYLLGGLPIDGVYTLAVEQENGFVVMEPGKNDLKSEAVIDWVAQHFPGKPITHAVLTHYHDDHSDGVRPFVAVGATIVVHAAAVHFWEEVFARPKSEIWLDALDRDPKPASVYGVRRNEIFRIDDAARPVVLYPMELAHTSDMLFAVLEKQDLLYAGDLYLSAIARGVRAGKVRPPGTPDTKVPFHSAVNLDQAMQRYGLDVPKLVGSHDRGIVDIAHLKTYLEHYPGEDSVELIPSQ